MTHLAAGIEDENDLLSRLRLLCALEMATRDAIKDAVDWARGERFSWSDTGSIAGNLEAGGRPAIPCARQCLKFLSQKERADKSRTLNRYEPDYETGELDARLYSQRAGTLATELESVEARIIELTSEPARPSEASVLSQEDQDQLLCRLEGAVAGGDIQQRKPLMSSVVESIEVHSLEDIRPTLRLFTQSDGGWTHDAEWEANLDRFASHHTGWS